MQLTILSPERKLHSVCLSLSMRLGQIAFLASLLPAANSWRVLTAKNDLSPGHGTEEKSGKVLTGKPEEKRPLVRPSYRSEDGIRVGGRLAGGCGVDWVGSREAGAGLYKHGDEPSGFGATKLAG
jgi:hypothetical protein